MVNPRGGEEDALPCRSSLSPMEAVGTGCILCECTAWMVDWITDHSLVLGEMGFPWKFYLLACD